MDRVKTGIKGLDKLVSGGIPKSLSVLVSGSCGTGKTILSLQYLYRGAKDYGEPGVYVTFEESREKILAQANTFGWDVEAMEKKGLLKLEFMENDDLGEILGAIKKNVKALNAKRLVIDSLTTMVEHAVIYRSSISKEMIKYAQETWRVRYNSEGSTITRKDVYFIVSEINKLGTTALLISEVGEKSDYLSRDTISEFATDGVIVLQNSVVGGQSERLLSVRKMRGTGINMDLSIIRFTKDGIDIVGDEA